MAEYRYAPHKVDPRLHFANERTLLAWIRTSVGLMALGFVVGRAGAFIRAMGHEELPHLRGLFRGIGVTLLGVAVVTVVMSWQSFRRRSEALMRGEAHTPSGRNPTVLAVALAILGLVAMVALATQQVE